jgi:hypothetical protein
MIRHRFHWQLLGLLGVLASPALAQVQLSVQIPVPTVRFEAPPPLVVVEPGVQVVEDYGEEVFFVDGWYWLRADGRWYRSRHHRGGWVFVEPRYVPSRIVQVPPGRYKHWKRAMKEEKAMAKEERGKGHGKEKR